MPDPPKRDLSPSEGAELLGVSAATVARWARDGTLEGCWQAQQGYEWHIPRESVEKMRRENQE